MALNIKNEEAHRLAQELSSETGQSITQVVLSALREAREKARRQHRTGRDALAAELDAIAMHCSGLPVLDERESDEILGYDEHGLPS